MYYRITVAMIANTDRQIEVITQERQLREKENLGRDEKAWSGAPPSYFLHSSQGDGKETFPTLLVSTVLYFG